MPPSFDPEVYEFLQTHLKAIYDNKISVYRETTAPDLTLYEWWVTPHRIEGLPFHEFMTQANTRKGTSFGADGSKDNATRFDLANLHIQRYGSTAIASYTLLVSTATPDGVKVVAHNESRVMVKFEGKWKVVHCHKSPAYSAPHST